ncbi:malonyl CoA-acyl carrier protein transacylase [Candidatus Photodesmus blepharus]|uniref:Malonyl CoA-acyl carrier protein transacylase n=1 Tax=Candidatus Photodesmus blepharonis TaxID=1179155 RepID=A0A084CN23_9GAMM|nr:ACP S-malonyltransferase [Candidatus Photodesmus blepharus]KEY91202.1 malonyl CoA-acyl carrier protein transacylase [Candidatus Photodesmus blepharus]
MGKFAVVFSGQGSQVIGMLEELERHYVAVKETFSEASNALGYDLWSLVQNGPEEDLNQTFRTQPALLAASVSVWRIWKELGYDQPVSLAGHSLGEYSALVCADVINFQDAIKLVELRGKLMQEAVPEGTGAMCAIIGLRKDIVEKTCKEVEKWDGVVSPANYNSPFQIVISGNKCAVKRVEMLCKKVGAKYTFPLSVSVPSHCALMRPAADRLAAKLAEIEFTTPIFPVINNVDVVTELKPEKIKMALVRQLYSPVRWTEIVQLMNKQGVKCLLEMGSGNRVLTGLTKRIVKMLKSGVINDIASLNAAKALIF